MPNATYNRDRCSVITNDGSRCSKTVSNAGFALASHNAMHLRRGELIEVSKWSWKGEKIESQIIQPRDRKTYESADWFETFERCKVAYVEMAPAPKKQTREQYRALMMANGYGAQIEFWMRQYDEDVKKTRRAAYIAENVREGAYFPGTTGGK